MLFQKLQKEFLAQHSNKPAQGKSKQQTSGKNIKKKILYFGFNSNSHIYKNYVAALDLYKTGKYDITYITGGNNQYADKLQEAGIEVVKFVFRGYYDRDGNRVSNLYHQFPQWLLHEQDSLIQYFKNKKFDMMITEYHEFHEMFALLFKDIPLYVFIPSHIEPKFSHRLKLQYIHSSHSPMNRVDQFGYSLDSDFIGLAKSIVIRLQNIISNCYYYLSSYDRYIYDLSRSHPTSVHIYENIVYQKRYPDLVLISTLMGANNLAFPIASNVKIFHNKYQQDVSQILIDDKQKRFYQKFEKIMIATKGSKMDFEHQELLSFYNFTYSRKDWGALKQQPNVLILPYINQPLLLSLSQTKILHCSGGKNSLYEAFSHGKPVLISPTNILDQFYMCENIHIQNLGRCLKDKNSEELIKAVEFIERNGFFKDQYQIFMEAVKFEQNNEEDFVVQLHSWI
eukprot:403339336